MTSTKQDESRGSNLASYEVGYGKPPHASQFKPGQSGNPRGRPKGSLNKPRPQTHPKLLDLILTESERKIKIQENGRPKSITVVQATLRGLGVHAIKGNARAAALLLRLVEQASAEQEQRRFENFVKLYEYKERATNDILDRQSKGLPIDDIIPHPDQIKLDLRAGKAWIVGPLTEDERPEWDKIKRVHDIHTNARRELVAELATEQDPYVRQCIESEIACSDKFLAITSRLFDN